ncbi:MAG TPA: LamG-like jellyroll fold domain-containing protein [Candidatus Sulfotelmatobacter sp.]|nr:LamG-like jellyroll fold domain-containing protein [Candidatus Sulfotelmatobacter sp.]
MRFISGRRVFLTVLFLVLSAAAKDIPLTFAKHETLESKILGEERDILVSEPAHPVPGMPLLILLDGEWNQRNVSAAVSNLSSNGRLPPMLVAGVVNTDRGRDLMPTFDGDKFAAGLSDRFLSFLADELIPKLAAEYPIGKYRILAGHSNAGMFSLYAFIRRPELFQANIALSPSFGLDDRFVAQLAGALAKPVPAQRFVFVGAGGDEEADISVGAMRFAKSFEGAPSADIEFHYEVFPAETHGSVGYRAFYRALEVLGQADPASHEGPSRYLSEVQRRRHGWIRRFGSPFSDEPLPLLSVARPVLDELATNPANLTAFWDRLRVEHADDFRFDAVERQNLIHALEARGRKEDASRLKVLPGFDARDSVGNNYGSGVDLSSGLVAYIPLEGSAIDLCHPDAKADVHGAALAPDRDGREGKAYRFNGHGTFIEFPGNPDRSTAGSISVSAWVRVHNPAAYSAWVSQVRSTWGSQWRLGSGPNPSMQWGATTLATRWTDYWVNVEGLPVDRWVHTAAVFDQTMGELHIYLNGREAQTFAGLAPWCASPGSLLIGAQRDDGLFFEGDVGEVRVYRRALNAAEVAALSNATSDSGAQSCRSAN